MQRLLTTARLYIRHLKKEDAAFILKLVNSPGWLAYIGDRNIKTEEAALTYIEHQQEGYKSFRFGLSAVCLHENDQTIGICGFLKREALPYRDIGYALLTACEGKGYATEVVRAAVAEFHKICPDQPLLAQVQQNNTRSIHLLHKLGFDRWKHPSASDNTRLYKIDPI